MFISHAFDAVVISKNPTMSYAKRSVCSCERFFQTRRRLLRSSSETRTPAAGLQPGYDHVASDAKYREGGGLGNYRVLIGAERNANWTVRPFCLLGPVHRSVLTDLFTAHLMRVAAIIVTAQAGRP